MNLLEAYRLDPCTTLPHPYWKDAGIRLPSHMRVVHDSVYSEEDYPEYEDEPYFRLIHSLKDLPVPEGDGVSFVTARQEDIPEFVRVINKSYDDLSVTLEQLTGYTQTPVYCDRLWILAVRPSDGCIMGCAIADLDRQLQEGILEWVQVLPEFRRQKVGQGLVLELLNRLAGMADFATVSGKVNNPTSPQQLYRKCGFRGEDVWHILSR